MECMDWECCDTQRLLLPCAGCADWLQRQVTRTALRRSLRLEAEREIGRLASGHHNPWPRATPTRKRVVSARTTLAAFLLHWRWYSTYPTPARREWCEATRDMPLDEAVRRMDGLATLNSSHVPHSARRGLPPRTQRAHLPLSQEMGAASGLPLQSRCRRRLTALCNTIDVVRVGEQATTQSTPCRAHAQAQRRLQCTHVQSHGRRHLQWTAGICWQLESGTCNAAHARTSSSVSLLQALMMHPAALHHSADVCCTSSTNHQHGSVWGGSSHRVVVVPCGRPYLKLPRDAVRARPVCCTSMAASFTWRSNVSVDSGSRLSAGRIEAFHDPFPPLNLHIHHTTWRHEVAASATPPLTANPRSGVTPSPGLQPAPTRTHLCCTAPTRRHVGTWDRQDRDRHKCACLAQLLHRARRVCATYPDQHRSAIGGWHCHTAVGGNSNIVTAAGAAR